MKYLRDLKELEGVRVLVRVDFNVPVKDGVVVDDFRIRKILPTLKYLLEKKARIIIVSHIETVGNPTLAPICKHLHSLGLDCVFLEDYKKVSVTDTPLILLENIRRFEGEKSNDKKFARELASLADIYVNDAFAVSHRAHASVSAITEFIPSYAGLLFEQEIKHLSSAFNPEHPFLFVLGGAKFETKLPLIEKFIDVADKTFVGGALANNFFKEQGRDVGASLVSPDNFNLQRFFSNKRLLLPVDEVVHDKVILDAGPKTVAMLRDEIEQAKYILWNGPLGAYEKGYREPTLALARMIADATVRGAVSILGGGDTLATIVELKIEDSFTFVSTGGGAMLEFLAHGTLSGIEALETSVA